MPVKLQDMLLKEYSSTKSSFHTNVLQIMFKIDFALPLLFPRDFARDSTFLPFLPISIPPNLDHYNGLGGTDPAVNTPRPSRGTRIESCDFIVLIGDP